MNKLLVSPAASVGGTPSHVPYVFLCVCFLCYPPVRKAKDQKGQAEYLNYDQKLPVRVHLLQILA